jgi:hypothetical protein
VPATRNSLAPQRFSRAWGTLSNRMLNRERTTRIDGCPRKTDDQRLATERISTAISRKLFTDDQNRDSSISAKPPVKWGTGWGGSCLPFPMISLNSKNMSGRITLTPPLRRSRTQRTGFFAATGISVTTPVLLWVASTLDARTGPSSRRAASARSLTGRTSRRENRTVTGVCRPRCISAIRTAVRSAEIAAREAQATESHADRLFAVDPNPSQRRIVRVCPAASSGPVACCACCRRFALTAAAMQSSQ